MKVFNKQEETRERYSPGDFVFLEKTAVSGNPDPTSRLHVSTQEWIATSEVQAAHPVDLCLFQKMGTLALHFAHYNFCRIHGKLKVTPAREAGITDHVWTLAELTGV